MDILEEDDSLYVRAGASRMQADLFYSSALTRFLNKHIRSQIYLFLVDYFLLPDIFIILYCYLLFYSLRLLSLLSYAANNIKWQTWVLYLIKNHVLCVIVCNLTMMLRELFFSYYHFSLLQFNISGNLCGTSINCVSLSSLYLCHSRQGLCVGRGKRKKKEEVYIAKRRM